MEKAAWTQYPRPQLRRAGFLSLNGVWQLEENPVNVPFPPQSGLSGYAGEVKDKMTYSRSFMVPKEFDKKRILLHFGAVDQIAEVWLNDTFLGKHEGGYIPFSYDITETVVRDGENRLRVEVTDTLNKEYPYGKQCKKRGGMWYTPVSGIWQSVWLENVPDAYIRGLKITPDLQGISLQIDADTKGFRVRILLADGDCITKEFAGNAGRVELAGAVTEQGRTHQTIPWTVEQPHLYEMQVITEAEQIETYFALRTISISNIDGVNRVCLNEKPVFLHGVLDQGYFMDGIFTPASEEEYEKDILRMKELGFNMLRKHIKVEPEAFYYYCDKHGMLVMQDMVNNGSYSFLFDTALPTIGLKKPVDILGRSNSRTKDNFIRHTRQTITHLYNHPCIVAYTIFNEGWGQFDSDNLYDMVKELDATRLVDSTSGWFAGEKSDFDSEHIYFKTITLQPKERPLFVSECGGYAYKVAGHCYNENKSYGYGTCVSSEQLTDRIIAMYENMILPAMKAGLCGCIYTQLSDVEDEINGMYTYDRQVCKVDIQRMKQLARKLAKEEERF